MTHEVRAPTLFVVATPIGNLGDITLRAIEILRSVHTVLAEDTRRARQLLTHLGLGGKRVVRMDAHCSTRVLEKIVEQILMLGDAALITDAGTPCISDPGAVLVGRAIMCGVTVVPIPGASAVTTALAASGFTEGPYSFLGFLPRRGQERERLLEWVASTRHAVVLFEAPGRARATLEALAKRQPERPAMVARELTKLHEELVRGTLRELSSRQQWRGELTIVVGPAEPLSQDPPALLLRILDTAIEGLLLDGWGAREISEELSRVFNVQRKEIYARVLVVARHEEPTGSGERRG